MPSFDPSPARRGLDALLARYPFFDLLEVERGSPDPEQSRITSSWILVSLGQPSETSTLDPMHGEAWARWEFAIWKSTGAVYTVGHDGAVSDDPIIEVAVTEH